MDDDYSRFTVMKIVGGAGRDIVNPVTTDWEPEITVVCKVRNHLYGGYGNPQVPRTPNRPSELSKSPFRKRSDESQWHNG